nr:hypothetical protein [Tanacetum cinerariifolium]
QAQPEDLNELFQKLLEDLKKLVEYNNSPSRDHLIFIHDNENHSVQNEESLENSSNEIAASNSDQEKEEPPQDFNILAPILLTKELEYSLSMEYEHLSITPETESDEVTKSNAKNLLPIPSECEVTSEDESKCDMPAKDDSSPAFTTFSNPLFNNNDNLDSSDNESLPEDHVLTEEFKVYSNPLFDDDESNSDKLDPYCFNVESYFVESLLNCDTFINYSFKFDFLLKEFSGELAHINPKIKESDFDFEEEIHLIENLLYDNSSSRLPKEHNAEEERIKKEHVDYISRMEMLFTINPRPRPTVNANTIFESLPSLPIPIQDGDSQREEIDIVTKMDELLPPGFKNNDSEGEIDVVDELHVDNSISNSPNEFFDNEASDFDNPSFPLPPPEPPVAEFEPDSGEEIPVVMNEKDEFDVSNDENDDYFPFMLSSESFCHILSVLRCFFLFSPQRVRTPSLTLDYLNKSSVSGLVGKDYAQNTKNQSKTRQYQHKIGNQQQKPDQQAIFSKKSSNEAQKSKIQSSRAFLAN